MSVVEHMEGKTVIQNDLLKLPPGILVHKILPFVGGVRNPGSQIASLEVQLKNFLIIAGETFICWIVANAGPDSPETCYVPHYLRANVSYTGEYKNRWLALKKKIDDYIEPDPLKRKGAYSMYYPGRLNFPAEKLLEYWVFVDQISLRSLQLVSTESLILYIKAHKPRVIVTSSVDESYDVYRREIDRLMEARGFVIPVRSSSPRSSEGTSSGFISWIKSKIL